jgi:1,5-anhydro-D-fructose reductase (1,5-anhydro-D-mannitol-forming)
MIRIGMLGYWHLHGADYARAAREHPDVEIAALWDDDAERGQVAAAELGVPFDADLDAFLARPELDGVVVCTATNLHRDVIPAAARAGKHVFSEKVVAATLAEAEQIIRATETAEIAFVVSMWRTDEPSTEAVADVLASGALGVVTQLRIRDGHPFALPTPELPGGRLPAQFWDPTAAQGGILIDLCHPAYLAAAFLGMPEDVSASFGRVTGRELEDNAVVTLRYPDGALAIIETSSATAITPFTIEAHGTLGSLVYAADGIGELVARRAPAVAAATPSAYGPDGSIHLRVVGGSPVWERIEVPTGPKRSAFEKWISHIQDGTRAPENVELARKLSGIIEASYRSDVEGRRVAINELGA